MAGLRTRWRDRLKAFMTRSNPPGSDARGRDVWRAYLADPTAENLLQVERERVRRYGVERPRIRPPFGEHTAHSAGGLPEGVVSVTGTGPVLLPYELWRGLDRLALAWGNTSHEGASNLVDVAYQADHVPQPGDQVTIVSRDMSEAYARYGEKIGAGSRYVYAVGATPEFVRTLQNRLDDADVVHADQGVPDGEQIPWGAYMANAIDALGFDSIGARLDDEALWAAAMQLPIFSEIPMHLWPAPQPSLLQVLESAVAGYWFTLVDPLLVWSPDTGVAHEGVGRGRRRINPGRDAAVRGAERGGDHWRQLTELARSGRPASREVLGRALEDLHTQAVERVWDMRGGELWLRMNQRLLLDQLAGCLTPPAGPDRFCACDPEGGMDDPEEAHCPWHGVGFEYDSEGWGLRVASLLRGYNDARAPGAVLCLAEKVGFTP